MDKLEMLIVQDNGKQSVDWRSLEAISNEGFVSFIQDELFKLHEELVIVSMQAYEYSVLDERYVTVDVIHSYDPDRREIFNEFEFYASNSSYKHTCDFTKLKLLSIIEKMNLELENIADIKQMSEIWGLSESRIKTMCQNGELKAKKLGTTWVVAKNQPNPKKYNLNDKD